MAVTIFSHGDSDGICSASLILAKYPKAKLWLTHPVGLLKDLKECDSEEIFICDVAISEKEKEELFEEFARCKKSGTITYIDHHPLPMGILSADLPVSKIITSPVKSTSELAYNFVKNNVPKEMDRVALFGAISDYCDHTEFMSAILDMYDKRTIYLESGLLSQCLGEIRNDYNFKREIIRELSKSKLPSQIEGVVKKALDATKKEWRLHDYVVGHVSMYDGIAVLMDIPKGLSPTKAAKFAIGVTDSKIGICTTKKEEHVDISVRKRLNFPLDLNIAMRTIALRFEGSGGGHSNAAGARVPEDQLYPFLQFLSKEISSIG